MSQSTQFADIAQWLLERAVTTNSLTGTISELGRRIISAGIPISRINCGALMLHPVLSAQDLTWMAATDHCSSEVHNRLSLGTEEFTDTQFFKMAEHQTPSVRYKLSDPTQREQYPILLRLYDEGCQDYLAFYVSYGKPINLPMTVDTELFECTTFSFTTDRDAGFSSRDIDNLRCLQIPLALAVKSTLSDVFSRVVLETYLGKMSGRNVLSGTIQRGQGRLIDCVLWYSDMRRSTRLSVEQDMHSYFQTINNYFECTADAVLDHGGEVLKFIGDGLLAIFPIEPGEHTSVNRCQAAATAALDAFSRLEHLNSTRVDFGLTPIDFGVALHCGQVIFGNVGVEKRMDMTVTGPAANEVARLEAMCKQLSTRIVVSSAFEASHSQTLTSLGSHAIPDMGNETELFTLDASVVNVENG